MAQLTTGTAITAGRAHIETTLREGEISTQYGYQTTPARRLVARALKGAKAMTPARES
jgi:hypothetical protein